MVFFLGAELDKPFSLKFILLAGLPITRRMVIIYQERPED